MNIKPLADYILIEPNKKQEKSKAGILLPETVEKEMPEEGKVIEVGPGKKNTAGKRIPLDIKKGDIVIFSKYGPTEIKIKDKEYLIAKQSDILAIVKK